MPKTLPAELEAQVGQRVTRPGWLVYVGFSTPLYLASFKDTVYDGHNWQRADVAVRSLTDGDGGGQSAAIEIGNNNNQLSAFILNEGINDKTIRIYKAYYGDDGTLSGVKGLFQGFGNGADLSAITSVTIFAETSSKWAYFSPRFRICEANGFNYLLQEGTVLDWGKTSVVLE